ncbi:alpha/beta fold hydrolase [Pseudoroseicyclus aestuarii]|uniref:alpha/beta fold hydrolase n=1 Tax=Pseudoroseicyclus aestuarii TaxID=1795041 RepID=UPI001FE31A59|nr:alpha/beta hydrolase [Pseudoroseicyclus aestuarii]
MKTTLLGGAAAGLLAAPLSAQQAGETLGIPMPADREGETISVNGADIFVQDSGEGDVIYLIHGYPLSGALFERVRGDLDDDHRVITIDQRGFGNSTAPEEVTDVATYAQDALAVLDELGIESATIGGMSMGGPVVFEMYREAPEVFDGMILIDSNHMPANAIEAGIWDGAHQTLEETQDVQSIVPFLLPNMLTGETRIETAPAQADYLSAVVGQASVEGALGGATVLANRPDSSETLASVEVPVLVLVGLADPVYAVEIAQQMEETAPNATLSIIDGASHAAIFEQPEASVTAIRDWMASQ